MKKQNIKVNNLINKIIFVLLLSIVVVNSTFNVKPISKDINGINGIPLSRQYNVSYIPELIVLNPHDGLIYGWRSDGSYIASPQDGAISFLDPMWFEEGRWPLAGDDKFISRPTIFDVDGDGDLEIISVTDGTGNIFAFHDDGTLVAGWPITWSDVNILSSPLICDVDGDGDLDILIITDNNGRIFAFDECSGDYDSGGWIPLQNWDSNYFKGSDNFPALTDINEDGKSEIAYTSRLGEVRLIEFTGTGFNELFIPKNISDYCSAPPIVDDINKAMVSNYYNVYSNKDRIQLVGGPVLTDLLFCQYTYLTAFSTVNTGRTDDKAINIEVATKAFLFGGSHHSNMHSKYVWDQIKSTVGY